MRVRVYHLQSPLDIVSQDTHSTLYHFPYSYLNYKSEPKLKLKGKKSQQLYTCISQGDGEN